MKDLNHWRMIDLSRKSILIVYTLYCQTEMKYKE